MKMNKHTATRLLNTYSRFCEYIKTDENEKYRIYCAGYIMALDYAIEVFNLSQKAYQIYRDFSSNEYVLKKRLKVLLRIPIYAPQTNDGE